MTTTLELSQQNRSTSPVTSSYRSLRILCWSVALILGAAQAWATRFTMNPDGVSYLDIGDAYWRGDWHNAINAYWSPLYSWILGFFLKVLKPTPYWEYPVAHLANFLIYVFALACFESFLTNFIADREQTNGELHKHGQTGVTNLSWWILGYSLFISSSVILIGTAAVTPDTLVAGFVYLASALVLRIYRGSGTPAHIALGCVLGLAYLAKSVMFPLAFVFLAVSVFARRQGKRSLQPAAAAMLAFLTVSAPLLAAISARTHHLTFGDSGSLNYSFYVNRVHYWPEDFSKLLHPMRVLSTTPRVYEFRNPTQGTFPPWYDPTYWHAGIKPRAVISGELEPLWLASLLCFIVFWVLFLNFTLGGLILYPKHQDSVRPIKSALPIAIPALATFVLYSLVHMETRFIAAQTAILLLSLYTGATFPADRKAELFAHRTIAAVASVSALIIGFVLINSYRPSFPPIYPEAASALSRSGIRPDDSIGLIWHEQWNGGAAEGAFVPRLLRLKIVVEMPEDEIFWELDPAKRASTIEVMRRTGIRAILARRVPANARNGWTQLGSTDYFEYFPNKD